MRDLGELLRGIAALLWPLVLIGFLLLFQPEIRALIKRVKRAKLLGQELELDKELDQLEVRTEAARQASPNVPKAPSADVRFQEDEVKLELLRTAATSPKAGLMLLSAQVEAQMRRLLASAGHEPRRPLSLRQMADELIRVAELPRATMEAVSEFSNVRNRIVHGRDVAEDEVLRAIDIGLELLDILRDLPVPRYVVSQAGLTVFADPDGRESRQGVTAVVLTVEGESDTRVYPTTLGYREGDQVSFDWNMERVWEESWYGDRDTGEIRYGWRTSAEFAGKPLHEV